MNKAWNTPPGSGAARKPPKETDAVRKKLESYGVIHRKIHNQNQRLMTLRLSMGSISSPNLSGMPGGGGNGDSPVERPVIKKDQLERSIERLRREERAVLDEIEALVATLDDPDQQTVIEMRYIDGLPWWTICSALFSSEPDYEEAADKYLKRTHRRHGAALLALAKVYRTEEG